MTSRQVGILAALSSLLMHCGAKPVAVEAPVATATESAAAASSNLSNVNPATPQAEPAEPAAAAAVLAEPLPAGTVVLHFGDSFVHSGLTQRLRTHFEKHQIRYEVRAQHSTNSLDWAKRAPELVASTQPDLVIITLGGNEIGSKHLDVQARAAKRIVSAIGDRPCVWMTPPLWMRESGLFDTLAESVAPCRFFETDRLVGSYLARREDKIHPTAEGGGLWADKLYSWLLAERRGEKWQLAPSPADEIAKRGLRDPLPR